MRITPSKVKIWRCRWFFELALLTAGARQARAFISLPNLLDHSLQDKIAKGLCPTQDLILGLTCSLWPILNVLPEGSTPNLEEGEEASDGFST
jgi:hypothetical protein